MRHFEVIQSGLQTHGSVAADVDGDADIDILTKPWSGDLHLFVENRLKRKTLEVEIKGEAGSNGFHALTDEPLSG